MSAAATDPIPPLPPRWIAAVSSPAGMGLVWLLHGLWFTLLLPLLTPTIAHVDANSADILQRSFALAYQYKNPPLYEWLELAVQAAVGPGPRSFLIVRYSLMGLMGLVVYAIVARASGSRPQGAAASLGLMSFYWFAWFFHDSISHSILVALGCLVFVMVVLRWIERPSAGLALALGAAIALGLLGKLNFAILLLAVPLTLALDPRLRDRLADRRLLLALPVAAILLAPAVAGQFGLGSEVAAAIYMHVVDEGRGWLAARLAGGGKLIVNYVLFLLPWGLVAAFAFRRRAPGDGRPAARPLSERFLGRLAVTTALLVLAGVLAIGARSVSERYLFPVLLAVPLYVHVAAGRRVGEAFQVRLFGGFALAVLVLVTAIRLFNVATATFDADDDNKRYDPYRSLAAVLAERGLASAFYVAADRYEAGNLSAFLPDARAAGLVTQRRWLPMTYPAGGRCLLFFRGVFETDGPRGEAPVIPEVLQPFVPSGATVESIRVPWHATPVGDARTGVFHLIDLGTGAAACRSVFGPADGG